MKNFSLEMITALFTTVPNNSVAGE